MSPARSSRAAAAPRAASDPSEETAVDLTVVVPAHNEERRLAATLAAVSGHLGTVPGLAWELIVVDDGSTDGTAALTAAAGRAEPRIRLLRSPANRGKGHAVRRGVAASRGRHVLFTDADLAAPITELARLQAAAARGYDAAIGSRARPASRIAVHQPAAREALGRLGNRVIRLLAVPGVADTQCGFKLFDGDKARLVFGLATIDGWAFDVEILHLFGRYGWSIAEVPVRWSHQPGSKLRPGDYLRVLRDLLRLRLRRLPRLAPAGRVPHVRPAPAGGGERTGGRRTR